MQTGKKIDQTQLRQFGLLVGGIFLLIALWPLISKLWALLFARSVIRLGIAVAAVFLIRQALSDPAALEPWYDRWMIVGNWLGYINTRIILGGIYYVLITPLGLFMRLLGYDPLRLLPEKADSYRSPARPREPDHFTKQY
jgi:hypothetical protein